MPGKIKKMIDQLIEARAQGNHTIAMSTKTKLILKGINPEKFEINSEDNPELIAKIRQIAKEWGIAL